jgi:hypothetical protein
MTRTRPPVALADGIRALGHLRPDDPTTTAQVLTLLGLSARELTAERPTLLPQRGEPSAVAERPSRLRRAPLEPVEAEEDLAPFGGAVPSSLDVRPQAEGGGISGVRELPKGEITSLPPIEPLFLPRWIRGIVGASLSVFLPDGPLDVERAVDAAARLEPVTDVPRLPAPTLRLGAQLLVDRSGRMTPFAKDQAWLELALHRILGENRVEVLSFTGTPRVDAYCAPAPGTPVLLLTDLGIGRPLFDSDSSDVDAWLAFVAAVRRAGCPLTAFVPYPPARWPPRLSRELTVIQWDRATSAATVRGRVRSGAQ